MSAAPGLRRGWCPSLQHPMRSGDGLLVRLGLSGQVLTYGQARGIAHCAHRFGNGLIDLTQRGNLQLRGVSDETLPTLAQSLVALGLAAADGPDDRDIIASPLAGMDPQAICDIRPLVAELRLDLAQDATLTALPDKFCWLIDDGGRIDLREIAADIRFEALQGAGSPGFAVALGGSADEATAIGLCAPRHVPDLAMALASAFLEFGAAMHERPRRMRDLVAEIGVDELRRLAGLEMLAADDHGAPIPPPRSGGGWPHGEAGRMGGGPLRMRTPPVPRSARATLPCKQGRDRRAFSTGLAPLGIHRLDGESCFLGMGLPFGRCLADAFERLADAAERHGGDIRLSFGRSLLVTGLDAARCAELDQAVGNLGLVTQPDDPRLAVVACPGAPACANATVETRADALALAPLAARLAQGRVSLHISGCAKGCARADVTAVTLIGRDGCYDLVLDGRAGDTPVESGFSLGQARAALARLASTKRAPAEARPRLHGRMG
jgi:precorrin-3B synthase